MEKSICALYMKEKMRAHGGGARSLSLGLGGWALGRRGEHGGETHQGRRGCAGCERDGSGLSAVLAAVRLHVEVEEEAEENARVHHQEGRDQLRVAALGGEECVCRVHKHHQELHLQTTTSTSRLVPHSIKHFLLNLANCLLAYFNNYLWCLVKQNFH